MKYPHLASRVFNTPLLIHPAKLDAILAGLGGRLLGADQPAIIINTTPDPEAAAAAVADVGMFATTKATGRDEERGYAIVNGVAIISIHGALVHRTRMEADSTTLLGYNDIVADMESAIANPNVHAVLQIWSTPGGEVQGAFECASRLYSMRGKKPIKAICDGMAASAGYLGASAADEIIISPTGYAGSIGVVARHVDFSAALASDGVKVTHIFAGAHKVDGNPYEPLPDAVREDWQAEIDGIYYDFLSAVATHRGISVDAVRKTQARTYRGQAAIDARLADRMGTTDQIIQELVALNTVHSTPRLVALRAKAQSTSSGQTARANADDKGALMSGNTPQGGQPAAQTNPLATVTVADLQAQRPDLMASIQQAAVAAELARQSGVRANALPGHEKLVEALASDGKTTPEQAAMAVLKAERDTRESAAAAHKADAPTPVAASVVGTTGDAGEGQDAKALAAQATEMSKAEGITVVEAFKRLGVTSV